MRLNLVLSLVKYQLIAAKPLEQFISGAGKTKKKNKIFNLILRVLALILISSSFIFLLGINYFGYMHFSNMFNILEKGIAFCTFSGTLFLLFVSTSYLEHTYFRGKDIKIWRLLPISKTEFFLSRFITNYVYSLMINLIVSIPLIVAIFYYLGFTLLTFLSSISLFLLLPILPLLLSSLLVILKIVVLKGKNIKIVDFLFSNGPFLVAILYLTKMSNEMTKSMFEGSQSSQIEGYFNYISNIGDLPYFSLMGKMFLSPYSFFAFIILAILCFSLSVLIIAPLFERCMNYVISENNNKIKKKKNSTKSNSLKSNNLFLTLIKRELFILESEKGFLSESISEMFIPIVLIIVWQISGSLEAMNQIINNFSNTPYFNAIIFTIVHLFASFVMISSTSVSREGRTFKLNKLLPIDYKLTIKAKVVFHLLFISAVQVVYLILFCIFFNIDLNNLLWMIPLFIINSINIALSNLFIDYSNPKLEWEVGISAMKRNVNGLISMLISIGVIAPSLLIVFFKSNLIIFAIIISLVILFIFNNLVQKAAKKLIYQD